MADLLAADDIGPAALLEWGDPIGIAFYPEHAAKADLIARMHALASPRSVHEVRRGEDALPFVDDNALIIVEPDREDEAVTFFDRNRDHFEGVQARVLILLLRGGAGERALGQASALSSFAREASFEIAPRLRREDGRAAFIARYGAEPEQWLTRWQEGSIADTSENNHALGEALALKNDP
jgi:hypothetical protein